MGIKSNISFSVNENDACFTRLEFGMLQDDVFFYPIDLIALAFRFVRFLALGSQKLTHLTCVTLLWFSLVIPTNNDITMRELIVVGFLRKTVFL